MSFDAITKADLVRKKKEVKIKVGEKELTFYANELSYSQRLSVAVASKNGDMFTKMILFSITDKDGNHMSEEQALSLSDEHASTFIAAANEVNQVDEEKN